MLSKDEENKLNMFFEIIKIAKEQSKFPQLGAYDIVWLCSKLKETNNELKKVQTEIDRNNEIRES